MAHSIRWHLDKRILLIDYVGDIDLAEVKAINEEAIAFLTKRDETLH